MSYEMCSTEAQAESIAAMHRSMGRAAIVMKLRAGVFEVRSWSMV